MGGEYVNVKSVISNVRECLICKNTLNLHRHHIYGGSRRDASERCGAWCYLCARHHNWSDYGVHYNRQLDIRLKTMCQRKLEENGMNRETFIETFGRNYLTEGEENESNDTM